MDLKLKDLAILLDVPESAIRHLIDDKKIPFYKIKNQYLFNKTEINEWILQNKIIVSDRILNLKLTTKPVQITKLIHNGGIHFNIKGNKVKDVIKNAINAIPVPADISKKTIIDSLLEREEMMTTAVGHGIAFPHPRNPIIADVEMESIALCRLEHPVDFHALDGTAVHTLFVIISSNSKRHLEILSKISYVCQQQEFIALLESKASKDSILDLIAVIEQKWDKR